MCNLDPTVFQLFLDVQAKFDIIKIYYCYFCCDFGFISVVLSAQRNELSIIHFNMFSGCRQYASK